MNRFFFGIFFILLVFGGCSPYIYVDTIPYGANIEVFSYCPTVKDYQKYQEDKAPSGFSLYDDDKCKSKIIVSSAGYLSESIQIKHHFLKESEKDFRVLLRPVISNKDVFINNLVNVWNSDIRQNIREHKYKIGMTREHILFSIGRPDFINKISHIREEWRYEKSNDKPAISLLFRGNKLINVK